MPRKSMYKHEDYTSLPITKDLIKEIDKVIADYKLPYVSRSDFARDAIRRLLEDLDKKHSKKSHE